MRLVCKDASASWPRYVVRVVLFTSIVLAGACKPRGGKSGLRDDGAVDPQWRGKGAFPIWAYDGGPNLQTEEGRALIELNSKIPYFPGLSTAIYGDQMFRPAFGPIPWRLLQKPNSVKILFIGQDGTHIAEASGRPATAGFGGRAQDLAKHFGVSSSAAFINTFAFTIRWQYGAFDTPIVTTRPDGQRQLSFGSYTGTPVWLISQDLNSPLVKWRNQLIEWIIRNNKESLKLIVLFGGGARDAAGAFIESKGGRVATRTTAEKIAQLKIKIAEFDLKGAGSNKQTASPFNKEGRDLLLEYAQQAHVSFGVNDYKQPAKVEQIHNKFVTAFNADPNRWLSRMVLPPDRTDAPNPQDPYDGVKGSGMVHPAQLGGYDIGRGIQIGNSEVGTLSLKGLKLGDDYTIEGDIIVTQLPHPTALSMMDPEAASASVNKALEAIKAKYPPNTPGGWTIDPDSNAVDPDTNQPLVNHYAAGEAYRYGRADMGAEYYDFGAPNSRMVNVSSASRDGANVIVFGTRDQPSFDPNKIKEMTSRFLPSAWNNSPNPPNREFPFDDEMWIARAIRTDGSTNPSMINRRYTFDAGPGEEMAKIMKTNLPRNPTFVPRDHDGNAVNGDFGHYRGTFNNPTVVILADPDGDDDLITARALTGTRGQFLHGLMTDLGVGDKYLVIKTAPYSKYSDEDWTQAVAATKDYRKAIFEKIMQTPPKLVLTDGDSATQEFSALFPTPPSGVQVIAIARQGTSNDSGIAAAGQAAIATGLFGNGTQPVLNGKMLDIPRSHLSYYARVWEGTSGDRVVTARDAQYRGKAFAEVAPKWAYSQAFKMVDADVQGCKALVEKELQYKTRLGQAGPRAESVTRYRTRMNAQGGEAPSPDAICAQAMQAANTTEGATAPSAVIEGMEAPDVNEPHGVDDRSDKIKYAWED